MTKRNILTIYIIVGQLPPEEIGKQSEKYEELLEKAHLWGFGGYDDPYLRRSTYKLLRTCLASQEGIIFFTTRDLAYPLLTGK